MNQQSDSESPRLAFSVFKPCSCPQHNTVAVIYLAYIYHIFTIYLGLKGKYIAILSFLYRQGNIVQLPWLPKFLSDLPIML